MEAGTTYLEGKRLGKVACTSHSKILKREEPLKAERPMAITFFTACAKEGQKSAGEADSAFQR